MPTNTDARDVVSSLADGTHGLIKFSSANPFEFKHILQTAPVTQQTVQGELLLPHTFQPGFEDRVPCVIALHGSWGWGPHHLLHLANLRAHGFATFRVDSFASRGIAGTSDKQLAATIANMQFDAYCALQLVASHPRVDATRVGLIGWSLGGGAAIYSALDPVASRLGGPTTMRFAAHLGFYPDAHYRPTGSWTWTQAPIAVFQGAIDDYTTTEQAQGLVDLALEQGARISMHLFPDSHHSFDRGASMKVAFQPKVVAACDTVDVMHPDGSVHVTGLPIGTAPVTEYEERRRNGRKYSKLGANAGGNAEQAAVAFRGVVQFFRSTLMGDAVLADAWLPVCVQTSVLDTTATNSKL